MVPWRSRDEAMHDSQKNSKYAPFKPFKGNTPERGQENMLDILPTENLELFEQNNKFKVKTCIHVYYNICHHLNNVKKYWRYSTVLSNFPKHLVFGT